MLNYRITSLADLDATLADFGATHLVSLVDPDMAPPKTPSHMAGRHIVLFMHDLDVINDGTRPGNPDPDHAGVILDFAINRLTADGTRVVFQCTAGRRRSAAAALLSDLAIQISAGAAPGDALVADAWDRMLGLRPIADPNRALLALGDDLIGMDGALARAGKNRTRVLTLDPDDGYQDL